MIELTILSAMNHSTPVHRGHEHEGEHLRGHLGECGHDHSESGMKWRLTLVLLGGVCLILSGILRWLRPAQNDLAVAWSMLGAIITALPIFPRRAAWFSLEGFREHRVLHEPVHHARGHRVFRDSAICRRRRGRDHSASRPHPGRSQHARNKRGD